MCVVVFNRTFNAWTNTKRRLMYCVHVLSLFFCRSAHCRSFILICPAPSSPPRLWRASSVAAGCWSVWAWRACSSQTPSSGTFQHFLCLIRVWDVSLIHPLGNLFVMQLIPSLIIYIDLYCIKKKSSISLPCGSWNHLKFCIFCWQIILMMNQLSKCGQRCVEQAKTVLKYKSTATCQTLK